MQNVNKKNLKIENKNNVSLATNAKNKFKLIKT